MELTENGKNTEQAKQGAAKCGQTMGLTLLWPQKKD